MSPSLIESPTATSIFQTLPVMWASMFGIGGDNSRRPGRMGRMDDAGRPQLSCRRREGLAVVVAAHEEADRIGATVAALRGAFPAAAIWVGDDASRDGTAERALAAGAQVVQPGTGPRQGRQRDRGLRGGAERRARAAAGAALRRRPRGERGAARAAGRRGRGGGVRPRGGRRSRGGSAAASAWRSASPAGRSGGSAASRRAPRSPASAPCGVETLRAVLPFARGFGMEIGMTVDAVRAGYRVGEYEIDLEHRATGRDAARLPPPRRPAPRLRPRLPQPPDPPFVGSAGAPLVTAPRRSSKNRRRAPRPPPCRCPR